MFSKTLISIDIGASAVKIVEVVGNTHKKLKSFGFQLLPHGAVIDGTVQDRAVVAEAIRELCKRCKISMRGRRVALSVGGSGVLIKKINVSLKDDADFSDQVFYEAEQQFQHDIADLYFDYFEVSGNPNQGETSVVLVGAKRQIIEQHIQLIHDLGMRAGVVDCGIFSIANMFEYNFGAVESVVALVNVGASSTQVCLVNNGNYLYTREISLAGEEYTRRIKDAMSLTRENAEALKISAASQQGGPSAEAIRIITEVNDQLVHEVQSSLNYFFTSGDAHPDLQRVSHVFLVGGGAKVLGFDAALAAEIKRPVQHLNPFHRVDTRVGRHLEADMLTTHGHLFGVAVGLSMRKMSDRAA